MENIKYEQIIIQDCLELIKSKETTVTIEKLKCNRIKSRKE